MAVTLITGDTVLWSDAGDGNAQVADIERAPRDYSVEFDQSGTQEDFYVIPSDVMEQVASGAVDMELFNIPSLIRQGLDDESTGGELPVIITFDDKRNATQLERDADALPATQDPIAVRRLNAAGATIDRDKAASFGRAVLGAPDRGSGAQAADLGRGVEKILLDRVLKIDLSESVPQIGAPEAWEAGFTGEGVTVAVLDTGIDDTHPDLAGQVVAAENFVGEGEAVDDHGHGTHVASTVAGTGAASDGARKGVAPDADLLSGKVCNAEGQCPTSVVMAGMEWAAAQGADVVNMSLGGGPTDGSDIQSQLLNQLSAETGTLFVASAGNSSGGLRQVGTPAAADAALAVGAVDKSDQMAWFSSRGPRLVDYAVKPEITAPGVDIVAARAAGTGIGNPVDDDYTSLDGTSMAAPHVAGAAALLAQAQPGLAGQQLKDALVSTAADGGHRWYAQGTGRVDVPAALDSPIYAIGTLNFGGVDGQAERDLVYTNRSDDDITLSLDAAVTDDRGRDIDEAGASLATDMVTVPARGTASVTVTVALDASNINAQESFGGVVTATGDGVDLRTAIGFGPPLHKVTIEVLDSKGERVDTDTSRESVVFWTHDTRDPEAGGLAFDRSPTSEGVVVEHVPAGTYTFIAAVAENEPGAPQEITRGSFLIELEVDIRADTTLTLDAREAVPVKVSVPHKAEQRMAEVAVIREFPGGSDGVSFVADSLGGSYPAFVTPTPAGELAPLRLTVGWTLAEPQALQPLPTPGGAQNCPRRLDECFSETPAYIYNLPFLYENGIPNDLHENVTRQDLVEVPTRFHSDYDDALVLQDFVPIGPSVNRIVLDDVQIYFRPGAVTEYFLADDRFSWRRATFIHRFTDGKLGHSHTSGDLFPAAEAGNRRDEERWHEGPWRVGVQDFREEKLGWHNDNIGPTLAVASRGGSDGDQFTVPFQVMGNSRGHGGTLEPGSPEVSWRMWNADTGAAIERSSISQVFRLAPGTATYRLEQTENRSPSLALLTGRSVTTTWTFTSRPSDAQVPRGYQCWIQQAPRQDVCQIQPLILLEYQLGLDIHNRAPAGRAHTFTVTAGHHSKAVDRAKVTDLSVEASFDGGETWTDARAVGKPKDSWETGGLLPSAAPRQEFKVAVKVPPLHRTNGFVTLRVKAEDANGGTVDQTIDRAYILKCGVKAARCE